MASSSSPLQQQTMQASQVPTSMSNPAAPGSAPNQNYMAPYGSPLNPYFQHSMGPHQGPNGGRPPFLPTSSNSIGPMAYPSRGDVASSPKSSGPPVSSSMYPAGMPPQGASGMMRPGSLPQGRMAMYPTQYYFSAGPPMMYMQPGPYPYGPHGHIHPQSMAMHGMPGSYPVQNELQNGGSYYSGQPMTPGAFQNVAPSKFGKPSGDESSECGSQASPYPSRKDVKGSANEPVTKAEHFMAHPLHDSADARRPPSSPSTNRAPKLPAQPDPETSSAVHIPAHITGSVRKLFTMGTEPERSSWLEAYLEFMRDLGKPLTAMPHVAKHSLDLFKLYHAVQAKGGVLAVVRANSWKDITHAVQVNASSSAAFTLRRNYVRYLLDYECHFALHGADPEPLAEQIELMASKKKRKAAAAAAAAAASGGSGGAPGTYQSDRDSHPVQSSYSNGGNTLNSLLCVAGDGDSHSTSMSCPSASDLSHTQHSSNNLPAATGASQPSPPPLDSLPCDHSSEEVLAPESDVSSCKASETKEKPPSSVAAGGSQGKACFLDSVINEVSSSLFTLPSKQIQSSSSSGDGVPLEALLSSTSAPTIDSLLMSDNKPLSKDPTPMSTHSDTSSSSHTRSSIQRPQSSSGSQRNESKRLPGSSMLSTPTLKRIRATVHQHTHFPHHHLQHQPNNFHAPVHTQGHRVASLITSSHPQLQQAHSYFPHAHYPPLPPSVGMEEEQSTSASATMKQSSIKVFKKSSEKSHRFPVGSVERVQPCLKSLRKRKRMTGPQLDAVDLNRVTLSLKSGLLAEVSRSLDTLVLLSSNESPTAPPPNLSQHPHLLDHIVQLFQHALHLALHSTQQQTRTPTRSQDLDKIQELRNRVQKRVCSAQRDTRTKRTVHIENVSEDDPLAASHWMELLAAEGETSSPKAAPPEENPWPHLMDPLLFRGSQTRCDSRDSDLFSNELESQRENALSRCVCLSTILRNLSSWSCNEPLLASHRGLLVLLGSLLARHLHLHNAKMHLQRELEESEQLSEGFAKFLLQNSLVTLINISGQLYLNKLPESVIRPLLETVVHFIVCPSHPSHSSQRFNPTKRQLSSRQLSLEALMRLSVLEGNVDLILATPSSRDVQLLFDALAENIGPGCDEPVIREMSMRLLTYLARGGEGVATHLVCRAKPCALSSLLAYLEATEVRAQEILQREGGIEALRRNPELIGTSLDLLRRVGTLLESLGQVKANQALFREEHILRLLDLCTSRVLDHQVVRCLINLAFALPAVEIRLPRNPR